MQKEKQNVKNYGLSLLRIKGYSVHEMRCKMLKKKFSKEDVEEVIEDFLKRGYLCDLAWTESFVRCQIGKSYGLRLIEQKLKLKGVECDLIEKVLEPYRNHETIIENIHGLLTKRYQSFDLKNFQERRKVAASLVRRGFSFQEVADALSRL